MSFKNILLPTDGSGNTEDAVRKAMELARLSGGKVTALYVLDHGTNQLGAQVITDSGMVNYYSMLEKEGKAALDRVRELGAQEGVEVDVSVKEGAPYKVIIEESEKYDVIVMGTLGRTGMSKLLIGSVAERVVRGAVCPVIVVRSQPTGD